MIKRCSCGAPYRCADWLELPLVGVWRIEGAPSFEQRNCRCGSTISLHLPVAHGARSLMQRVAEDIAARKGGLT